MEQIKKLRVAMICHFSNSRIRTFLPLDNRELYTFARKVLRMPTKSKNYGDIAPWDTSTIDFFRNREDIILYVISAHSGLKQRVVSFYDRGVHYDFVKCDIATMLKRVIPNAFLWRLFNPMVKDVHRLVHDIKPDLVLLIGLENAYYSSTVLGIKDYPVFALCQTIYNNPERSIYDSVDKINSKIEKEIIKEKEYFGVYCRKHYDLLKRLAPNAFVFKFGFPSTSQLLEPITCEKQFDFVNFAMSMSAKKGFIDSIEAIAIVKKAFPNVRLNLVGGGSSELKKGLVQVAESLGVKDNVIFTPFFEKQEDLFLHIQKARYALLPCKMDNVSGTMNQAMQLGIPLIVYKTTGTPVFNLEKECVLIAEHSDVKDLAAQMLVFLEYPERAETLAKNAREFQEKRIEANRHNCDRLVENFMAICSNYYEGIPIPTEQLFNPETDD